MLLVDGGVVDFLAVAVENARYDLASYVLAVVGHGGVGVGKLKQIDVAGAKWQRGGLVERALDAHLVGCLGYARHAHLHSQAHGHGVDASCKGTHKRHGIAGE